MIPRSDRWSVLPRCRQRGCSCLGDFWMRFGTGDSKLPIDGGQSIRGISRLCETPFRMCRAIKEKLPSFGGKQFSFSNQQLSFQNQQFSISNQCQPLRMKRCFAFMINRQSLLTFNGEMTSLVIWPGTFTRQLSEFRTARATYLFIVDVVRLRFRAR